MRILVVRVGYQLSSFKFTIEDPSGSAELTFNEIAKKWRANVKADIM